MVQTNLKLSPTQWKAYRYLIDNVTTEIVFGGGVFGGKTYLACCWLILNCLNYKGTRWGLGRSKLKQLKQTTFETFKLACKDLNIPMNAWSFDKTMGEITFWNGSQIFMFDLFLYPSDVNYDRLGSYELTGAYIDEIQEIPHKAWTVMISRIRYMLDEYNLIPKILGGCNPGQNWVKSEFYNPWKNNKQKMHRRFVQSLITDNKKYCNKQYLENLERLPEADKERLLYGNWDFDDDPRKLFMSESLNNMKSNVYINKKGKRYVIVDPAGLGVDRALIMVFDDGGCDGTISAGKGYRLEYIKVISKCTQPELKIAIEKVRSQWGVPKSRVLVDSDGLGVGLAEFGGYNKFQNNGKAKDDRYKNMRSQCYFGIADLVNKDMVYVSPSISADHFASLVTELNAIKHENPYKDEEKDKVTPKDQLKDFLGRSPDFADCFMMFYYFLIITKTRVLRDSRTNGVFMR